MELRQLQYLVAVVEEGGFSAAARRVHVAQPGISAQIRRLETEIGQPLLDRSGPTVTPTSVGAAVLPYARAALAAVASVRTAADELTGLVRGQLTIGTVTSISSHAIDVPALLAGYHRRHPAVALTLAAADTDHMIGALKGGRFDVAFVGLGPVTPAGITAHTMIAEPLVAAVRPDHPLAGKSEVTLKGLARHPLISLPRGTGLRASLDEACATAGLTPDIALEASDPPVLAQLAAHGLGVAIIPQAVAAAWPQHLHTVQITRPRLQARIALAWRDDALVSPAARAFIDHVRQAGPAAVALESEPRR